MGQFEACMDLVYQLIACLCPIILFSVAGFVIYLVIRNSNLRRAERLQGAIRDISGLDQARIEDTIHADVNPTAPLSKDIVSGAQLLGKLSTGDATPLTKGTLKSIVQVYRRYYEQASLGYLPETQLNDLRRDDLIRINDFCNTLMNLIQAAEKGDGKAVRQYYNLAVDMLPVVSEGHRYFGERLAEKNIRFPLPQSEQIINPQSIEELVFLKNQLIADLHKGNISQRRTAASKLIK